MQNRVFITDYLAEKIQYFNTHKSLDALYYETACIGYLVKGSAEYLWEGKKYLVEEGDLIYIPKDSSCVSIWKGFPDIVFYSVNFDYLYEEDMELLGFQIVKGIRENCFRSMVEWMQEHYMKSLGQFYMLLDELLPRLQRNDLKVTKVIIPAIQYLNENYISKINVSDLAGLCNLSVANFYVHFKAEMGCTPIEYKNNLLVQKGADLLLNHGMSVEETAKQLGFSSTAYFRRMFLKFTGKLPKEFKK